MTTLSAKDPASEPVRPRSTMRDVAALAGVGNREYDIGRDGKRVGLIETGINANAPASASQMQIVLNWFEELKQRTAVK